MDIIGTKIVDNRGEEIKNVEEIFQAKLIGLLFSASWCSPCRIFERELIDLYNEANQGEKVISVILISFDKTEEAYKKWIQNKPWTFVPFNDEKNKELCETFQVMNIPQFVILDAKGRLVSDCGRKELSDEGLGAIDKWIKISERLND